MSVLAAGLVSVFISVSELSSATVFVSDSEVLSDVVSTAVFNSTSEVCTAVSVETSFEILFLLPHPVNSMHRMMSGRYFTCSLYYFPF